MKWLKRIGKGMDITFDVLVLVGLLVFVVALGGPVLIVLGLLALGFAIDPKMGWRR